MVTQAKQLIERVKASEPSTLPKDDIMEVITTIAVYKFINLSRVEVEAMLGIDLEQTRVYQEAKEEGRQEGREALTLELVSRMLARGMTQQEVADLLGLTLAQVRQIVQAES
ncbi:DUF2887 domain-containing protein [Scytonema sp. UIC 10036]|uniref:DUF2887 domain-containing protein n=1 Tax=Scytonema sp. UIC 10036 TaxID=2304196 RepID=UPI0012DAD058|nr:DUF2887 domain-containing protein [Scytonema sp. UIC 10036]MUG95450.1 DUF2887 domain-containing protein [Scytonema sp. UIC 10036]